MKALKIGLTAAGLCLATGVAIVADHHAEGQAEMPPMGPPAEMQQLESMNGEYAVSFFYKMDPASEEWVETKATAVLSTVAGGSAQQLLFEGDMMGMPFSGMALTSYDRATQKWQSTWVDSMAARITMYTGDLKDGKLVMTGEDLGPDGTAYSARLTTYNMTDEGYDWTYEMSLDGGATFVEGAKATYRRQ